MVLQNLSQSTLDLSVKNNFNMKMIKNIITVIAALIITSCQSLPTNSSNSPSSSSNQALIDQIKSDKKKQAELDLPFRGFNIDKSLETIALGSCADQDQAQPIWSTIEKHQPELMIMLGDNIYASSPLQKPISEQYNKMKKISEYRSIREKVPFMATWDDHDYGKNDGGETNPEREEARSQFFKNWPYAKNIAPDKNGAIYHAKLFGEKKNTLQVIMLDTRTNRSDLKKNVQTEEERKAAPKPYLSDESKDKRIISEAQWQWLEDQLKKPAGLRIIGTSIQVIANDHQFEKWGNFPHERERFFNLLKKLKIKNVLLVSGDRHMAAIAKTNISGLGDLYEVTASGLNKPARAGNNLNDSSYIAEGYGPVNFGLVKINWATRQAQAEIRSLDDQTIQSVKLKF